MRNKQLLDGSLCKYLVKLVNKIQLGDLVAPLVCIIGQYVITRDPLIFVSPSGPSEDCDNFQHAQRGVIPHSFEKLFALIKKEQLLVSSLLSNLISNTKLQVHACVMCCLGSLARTPGSYLTELNVPIQYQTLCKFVPSTLLQITHLCLHMSEYLVILEEIITVFVKKAH